MTVTQELQALNQQEKVAQWAERISACRSSELTVAQWCTENGVSTQTYYKWQRRLFHMAQAQQKSRFAEITPALPCRAGNVAVTVRIAGNEADIHSGADAATVRILYETILHSPPALSSRY